MYDAIKGLYYGNFEPMEMTGEYALSLRKQLSRLTTIEEKLYSRLTDEDKYLFEKYCDACVKFNSTSCADSFLHGFRLGGKIAVEMLDG